MVNSKDSKIISFLGDKRSELVEITQINDCIANMKWVLMVTGNRATVHQVSEERSIG